MRLTDKNAIREALRGGRRFSRVTFYASPDRDERLEEIARLARAAGAEVLTGKPDPRGRGDRNPGAALEAECAEFQYADLSDLIARGRDRGAAAQILALDHVQDPHNLGAIIRSAAAADAAGIIIERRRCCPVTAVAYETSSGAAEQVPVAQVANLRSALEELKKHDFWIAGADERADQSLYQAGLDVPLVWALGAEGRGLGRLIRETCDFLVRIPAADSFPSLNVSVAAGVLLFEARRIKLGLSSNG